ncbi:hypothetical protein DTL42_25650 [Bremerella cremea]|uniref:Uncharacterized protein n=1 Tax=Bremerella cremea TaxID=1031537 RepID=A0A368KLQ5_9BACT|nr:hypothetical protein [Bremerella cremea]RCS40750.1 hypothetical protein DTL42_25650 [Bremerella cremea]
MAKVGESIDRFNSSVRTLLILLLLIAFSTVSYYGYSIYNEKEIALAAKDKQLEEKNLKIGELEDEIDQLALRLKLLKIDRRIARMQVVSQTKPEGAEHPQTVLQFVELDQHGTPLSQPQKFTIEGDMVYINGKVVKFADELVESADPLRSTSICLLQKIYGEHQTPAEGFAIDKSGERPEVYGVHEKPTEFEQKLWENFWEIANDPDKAQQYGVRSANEESPGMKVKQGKQYEIEIRSSGGLTIKVLPNEVET